MKKIIFIFILFVSCSKERKGTTFQRMPVEKVTDVQSNPGGDPDQPIDTTKHH